MEGSDEFRGNERGNCDSSGGANAAVAPLFTPPSPLSLPSSSSTLTSQLTAKSNQRQLNSSLFRDLFDLSTTVSNQKKGKTTVTKYVKEFVLQRRPVFKGSHVAFEDEVVENLKEVEESIHKNNKELKFNLFKGCKPLDQFTGKLALMPLHRVNRELEIKHGGFNTESKEAFKQSNNEVLLSRGKDFRLEIQEILNISSESRLRNRAKLPPSPNVAGKGENNEKEEKEGTSSTPACGNATATPSTGSPAAQSTNPISCIGDYSPKSGSISFPETTINLGEYAYNSMREGKSLANASQTPLYWCKRQPPLVKLSETDKEVVLFKESRLISESYCQITVIGVNITGRMFNVNNTDSMDGDAENNNSSFAGAVSRISRYIKIQVYSFWNQQRHEIVMNLNEIKGLVVNIINVCTVGRRLALRALTEPKNEPDIPDKAKPRRATVPDEEGSSGGISTTDAGPAGAAVQPAETKPKLKPKVKEIKVKSIAVAALGSNLQGGVISGISGEIKEEAIDGNHVEVPALPASIPEHAYGPNRIIDEDEQVLWSLLRPGMRGQLMNRITDSLFFRYTIGCEKGQRQLAKVKKDDPSKDEKKDTSKDPIAPALPVVYGSIGPDGRILIPPSRIRRDAKKKKQGQLLDDGVGDDVSDSHSLRSSQSRRGSNDKIDVHNRRNGKNIQRELNDDDVDSAHTCVEGKEGIEEGVSVAEGSLGGESQQSHSSLVELNAPFTCTVEHLEDPVLPEGYPKSVHSIMTLILNGCRFSEDQSGNPLTLYVPNLSEELVLGVNKRESSRTKRARTLKDFLEKRDRENEAIKKRWLEIIPRKRGLVFSRIVRRLGRQMRIRIYSGGLDYLLQPPKEDVKRVVVIDMVRDGRSVMMNVGYSTLFSYSCLKSELHFSQWSEDTLRRTYMNLTKALTLQPIEDDLQSSAKPDPMGHSKAKEARWEKGDKGEDKDASATNDMTQTMTIKIGKLFSAQFDHYPLPKIPKVRRIMGHLTRVSSANTSLKLSDKEMKGVVATNDLREYFVMNLGGNVNLRRTYNQESEFTHERDAILTHAYQMYPPSALSPPADDLFVLETKQKGVKLSSQRHLKFPSSSSADILNGNIRLLRVVRRLGGVVCIITVYLLSKPIPKKTQEVPIYNLEDYRRKLEEEKKKKKEETSSMTTTTADAALGADPSNANPSPDPGDPEDASRAITEAPKAKKGDGDEDLAAAMFSGGGGGDGDDSMSSVGGAAQEDLSVPKQAYFDHFAVDSIFRVCVHRTDNCFSHIRFNEYFNKYEYYFDLNRDTFFSFFLSDEGLLFGAFQSAYENFYDDLGSRSTAAIPKFSDNPDSRPPTVDDKNVLPGSKRDKRSKIKTEEIEEVKSNVIERPVYPYPHCLLSWANCYSIWSTVMTRLFEAKTFQWTLGLAPSACKPPKPKEKKVYNPDDDDDEDYFAPAVEEIKVYEPPTVAELLKCCYFTGTDGLNGKPDRISASATVPVGSAPASEGEVVAANTNGDPIQVPIQSQEPALAARTFPSAIPNDILVLLPSFSTIVVKGNFRMKFSDQIYTKYGKEPALSPLPQQKPEIVAAENEKEEEEEEEEDGKEEREEEGEGSTAVEEFSLGEVDESLSDCENEEEMLVKMAEMEKKMLEKAATIEKKMMAKIAADGADMKKVHMKRQRKGTRAMQVFVWQVENQMGLIVHDPLSTPGHLNITNAIICYRPPLMVQALHISMTRFMTAADRYTYFKFYCMNELRICKVHSNGEFTKDREIAMSNGND